MLLRPEAQGGAAGRLRKLPGFEFLKLDIADKRGMELLFACAKPEFVIHLAAQAGVRYSLKTRMPMSTAISSAS